MNRTIYFPTFEPPSEAWLKFALLYMESFEPIIPDSGLHQVSNHYLDVINSTDLIAPYNPDPNQGYRASLKAIEFVEKAIRRKSYGIARGQNLLVSSGYGGKKDFKIFSEKFSADWFDYCTNHNLSNDVEGGMLVSKELAFTFMSFLAQEIAFDEGMSLITDNTEFDNFLNYQRIMPYNIKFKQKCTQGILSLILPNNISEIPIRRLIDFRNDKRELIRSFNIELDIALNNIECAFSETEFIRRFNNIYGELSREILSQGLGITTIPFGTYLLIKNDLASTPDYVKEVIGGMGLLLTAGFAINSRWKEIANKHNCRRYITNLGRLH